MEKCRKEGCQGVLELRRFTIAIKEGGRVSFWEILALVCSSCGQIVQEISEGAGDREEALFFLGY
ncbi:hypothetical protein [Thermosulfuriphilus sp.]